MQFHLWVNLHVGFAFYCGLAINLATTTELPSPNQFICRSHYFHIFICTLDRPVKFVTICFLIYCRFATIYRLNIFHYSLLKPMGAFDTIVNYGWMVIINFSQFPNHFDGITSAEIRLNNAFGCVSNDNVFNCIFTE